RRGRLDPARRPALVHRQTVAVDHLARARAAQEGGDLGALAPLDLRDLRGRVRHAAAADRLALLVAQLHEVVRREVALHLADAGGQYAARPPAQRAHGPRVEEEPALGLGHEGQPAALAV